jgi:hypothetical protein
MDGPVVCWGDGVVDQAVDGLENKTVYQEAKKLEGRNGRGCRVRDGADVGGAKGAGLDDDEKAADGEQGGGHDVPRGAVVDKVEQSVELGARACVSTPGGVLALRGMAEGVVEREDEREEGLRKLVVKVCLVKNAHHCRGRAALDVLHDAEEDGDAAAQCEQQHHQQRAHRLDAPCPPPDGRAGLGPRLFSLLSALAVAERYRDVSRRQVWLCRAVPPGFNCDDGEARQQQHHGDGVQRLVEGERVVDGRRGAQVPGC